LSFGGVKALTDISFDVREREIRAFTAREYWTLKAVLVAPNGDTFEADLVRIDGKKPEIGDSTSSRSHQTENRRFVRSSITASFFTSRKRKLTRPKRNRSLCR